MTVFLSTTGVSTNVFWRFLYFRGLYSWLSSIRTPLSSAVMSQLLFQERISPSVKEFIVAKPKCGLVLSFVIALFAAVIVPMSQVDIMHFITENPWVMFTLSVLVIFATLLSLNRYVIKESVIFILSTGVQVKQFNVFGLATSTRFFPKSKIKAFVINETIRRQRVVTYLALILNSPDKSGGIIVPLFHETMPRLTHLKKVYRESYSLINT